MAGKNPQQVVIYNSVGKFIRVCNSISEFRKHYYPGDAGTRPIFSHKELETTYHIISDMDLIAVREKVGRKKIQQIIKIHNCVFCKNHDNMTKFRPIQVINRRGEVIAEFKTLRLLTKLMPHIPKETISHSLKRKSKAPDNFKNDLIFQYKK